MSGDQWLRARLAPWLELFSTSASGSDEARGHLRTRREWWFWCDSMAVLCDWRMVLWWFYGDFIAISWYLVVIGVDFRLWWFISWSLWIVLVIGIVIHSVIYAYFVGTKKTRRTPQLAIDIPTSVWIGQNVTVWILYKWTYINGILFIVGFDYKRVWTWCVFD